MPAGSSGPISGAGGRGHGAGGGGTRPLRVGVVGAGWMAGQHVAELQARDDVEVRGVVDLDLDRADGLAASCGATGFASWEEMFERSPLDAVWACTPPSAHLEVARAAFARGLHVYLEKPIARTMADGRGVVEAAAEAGVVCAVGYQWHALDLVADVREALTGRRVGFVLGRNIGATKVRPWFVDRAEGGGNVLERASHHIDLVRSLAGEVASVQVGTSSVSLGGRPPEAGDVEDALTVVLGLESGAMATILVVWLAEGLPSSYGVDLAADRAWLHLDLDPDFTLRGVVAGSPVRRQASSPALRSSIQRFVAAVRKGDPGLVACRPDDALRTLEVALAAEKALVTGMTVRVGEDRDGPRPG